MDRGGDGDNTVADRNTGEAERHARDHAQHRKIFDAKVDSGRISLDNLYVVNGEHFTEAFPLFQGKVQNRKLQIPLPKDFFD